VDTVQGTCSVETQSVEKEEKSKQNTTADRKIVDAWFKLFPWLVAQDGLMFCRVCQEDGVAKNSFTKGCSNFRKSALADHSLTVDHQNALKTPIHQSNTDKLNVILMTEEERAVAQAVKAVHWIVMEDLPLSKYPSLVSFMNELHVDDIEKLNVSKNVSYNSRKTAYEILEAMADRIDDKVTEELQASPVITVLADETTDITVTKRMGIYARLIDSDMTPKTRFVTNRQVENGTAVTLKAEIMEEMASRGVPVSKLVALGSDGAAAMTGRGKGVTGLLLREQPHLLNVHCVAHRLALCTSQAAEDVSALQDYQSTLTSLFYYFKGSANRVSELSQIQAQLESPQLKIKEVHSVRWLSFYSALDTVYRCLDPLLTYLCHADRSKDPKAQGLKKKVCFHYI
jgi:hypothetical protein